MEVSFETTPKEENHDLTRTLCRQDDQLYRYFHLAQKGVLTKLENPESLHSEIDRLVKEDPPKKIGSFRPPNKWLEIKKTVDTSLLLEVRKIGAAFGLSISTEQLTAALKSREWSVWNQICKDLHEVTNLEKCHIDMANEVSDSNLVVVRVGSHAIGRIWVFTDPTMVSIQKQTQYCFAQGIRSSLSYILCRCIYPELPSIANCLISGVERWAREHSVFTIRINPLESMGKTLTERHGYSQMEDSEQLRDFSHFLECYFKSGKWAVIKFLGNPTDTSNLAANETLDLCQTLTSKLTLESPRSESNEIQLTDKIRNILAGYKSSI